MRAESFKVVANQIRNKKMHASGSNNWADPYFQVISNLHLRCLMIYSMRQIYGQNEDKGN